MEACVTTDIALRVQFSQRLGRGKVVEPPRRHPTKLQHPRATREFSFILRQQVQIQAYLPAGVCVVWTGKHLETIVEPGDCDVGWSR